MYAIYLSIDQNCQFNSEHVPALWLSIQFAVHIDVSSLNKDGPFSISEVKIHSSAHHLQRYRFTSKLHWRTAFQPLKVCVCSGREIALPKIQSKFRLISVITQSDLYILLSMAKHQVHKIRSIEHEHLKYANWSVATFRGPLSKISVIIELNSLES